MIESITNIFKWYAKLSNSVKVMVVLTVIATYFVYREYSASKGEKDLLYKTIEVERFKLTDCEEDKERLYNYLIDFNNKDKKIDSLNKI